MQSYEDVFKRFFQNNDMPNPFDGNKFREFIQNQIQSAIPDLEEYTDMANSDSANQGSQNSHYDVNYRQREESSSENGNMHAHYPAQRPHRKGTTSGMSRPSPSHNHVLNYNAFETHDNVIIRIAVPQNITEQPSKILLNSHRLFVKSEESAQPLLQLHMPKLINPEQTRIDLRNNVLEIVLPKKEQEPLSEIRLAQLFEENDGGTNQQ